MRELILILKRSAFQHFCDSSRCYTFCSNFTVQKCENCANCECICTKPASVIYIYSLRFHISDSVFTHCDDWTDWSTREFWKPVNMLPFCNFMQTCLQLKLIEHVGQLMFLHSVLAKIYFSHYLGGFHQPLINQFPNSSQPYIFASKSPLFPTPVLSAQWSVVMSLGTPRLCHTRDWSGEAVFFFHLLLRTETQDPDAKQHSPASLN